MGQQQPPFRQAVRRGAESGHAVRRRQHGPVRPQRLYYLVQDQRVRRREQPGGIRFPMHVQCRQPRYVDHERPNDSHVPVRRSRQVHRGRAGYFRIQPARLPVRFPAPVPEKPDVRRHQCPRPAARIRVRGQRRPDDGQGPRRHGLVRDDLCRRVSRAAGDRVQRRGIQDGRRGKLCQGGRAIRQSQLHGRSDRDVPVQRRERQPALVPGRGGQNLRG